MRARLKHAPPETRLERLLEALERELLGASDEEILAAAHELGMQPHMQGSAAFLGLRYPMRPRFEDFFAPQRGGVAGLGGRLAHLPPRGAPDEEQD